MIKSQLVGMGLSQEEIEKALAEGDKNEHYAEAEDLARDEFESDVKSEIENEGNYYDDAKEFFTDMTKDGGDLTELEWLYGEYLTSMFAVADQYGLSWPILTRDNSNRRSASDIAQDLSSALKIEVQASYSYHGVKRRPGLWIIEPDSSLDPDDSDEESGLEIVSPPMPLPEALAKLKELMQWASGPGDAYTNESTGLHMGVSIANQLKDVDAIDTIKLIMFLGDQHVLESFGREANTYCRSAFKKIQEAVKQKIVNPTHVMNSMRKNMLTLAGRYISSPIAVGRDKYTSVHLQDGYIEFRSPGGDYLNTVGEKGIEALENTMLRFARAMQIAGDPQADTQEYAKKLYKTITNNTGEHVKDTKTGRTQYRPTLDNEAGFVNLFSAFAAGKINAEELKDQWASVILKAKTLDNVNAGDDVIDPNTEYNWEVYDVNTGEIIDRFTNVVHSDAYRLAQSKWGQDQRTLRVRIEDSTINTSPERVKKAQSLISRERWWKLTNKTTNQVQVVKADNQIEAMNIAARNDTQIRVAFARDQLDTELISAKKAQELLAQQADNAQDSADLQATVTEPATKPIYNYQVTNRNGEQRTIKAETQVQAQILARQQFPDLFGGPGSIANIRTVSGLAATQEPSAEPQQLAPAPFPSQEEPEYQIVHRRTGNVIYRFSAPSVPAAQAEFMRRTDNDPQSFGLYPVLAEGINEGWRDWVMGAGVGAIALGGGGAAYDAYKAAQSQPNAQVAQGQVTKTTKQLPLKQMGKLERIVADAAQRAGITGTELKQFLAQVAHESDNFGSMEEIGTNQYFAKKYDKKYNPVKAKRLGNTHVGDGVKFKGRGFIQLTGRYNYTKAGEALGLPLADKPELAARPDIAAKIAVWFWKLRVQPKVQDYSDVAASTKPINPALRGLESRKAHFDKYSASTIPGVAPTKKA
jgi:predicted chitinase